MAKQAFIVIVGSGNVDLTTFNDVFPRPGETIFGKKFDLGFGGKGANQAVAARLCGANVGIVAKVGSDLFGPATIKNFESQGIDATHVRIAEGVSSGVAPIFVDPSGQNRIIVVKGANDTLSPEDVDAAACLLRKANTIVLQFEIPLVLANFTVWLTVSNGISNCRTIVFAFRSRHAAASTSSGESVSFAPFTTMMRFWPLGSTKMGATPLDTPSAMRTCVASIPCDSKFLIVAGPKRSLPTFATMPTFAPHRRAATA